ncbi:MAG TPA: RagB/SusD family nutrient uptake outer membrane protein [Puia sp.]
MKAKIKSIKIYRPLFLSLLLCLGGCSKSFLDVQPPSVLTGASYYRNATDAEAAITAAYSSVRNFNTDNYAKITEAPLTDMMIFNTQGLNLDSWSLDPNDVIPDDVWQGAYEGIFRANLVLQHVPDISMDAAEQSRILGEAYFLRALFYWQLSTVFGPVPIVPEADPSDPSKASLPNNSVDEINNGMIGDLQMASSLLPKRSGYGSADLGRATKGAAQALLGKVYLYAQNYPLAETYLDSVITSGEYQLIPSFGDLLVTDNNAESIFEIQYADITGQGSDRIENDYPQGQGGFSNLLPTQELVDAFESSTGSTAVNGRDPRLFYSVFQDGDPYDAVSPVFKNSWTPTGYARKKGSFPVVRTSNANLGRDFPIIRLADVLLMYAEAANENGHAPEAIAAINKVRERVGMEDLPTVQFPTGTKEEIFAAVVHERTVELAFEHTRLNDLQRWGMATQVLGGAGYTAPKNRYFPIPQQEINNNPQLVQNEGY